MLAIVRNTETRNLGVQLSGQHAAFISFGYLPSSGIGGSYSSSTFNILRNLSRFHNSYSNFHQIWKALVYYYFKYILLFSSFLLASCYVINWLLLTTGLACSYFFRFDFPPPLFFFFLFGWFSISVYV